MSVWTFEQEDSNLKFITCKLFSIRRSIAIVQQDEYAGLQSGDTHLGILEVSAMQWRVLV